MSEDFAALLDTSQPLELPQEAGWVAVDSHFAASLPQEDRPGWRCEWWESQDSGAVAFFWGELYNPEDFSVSQDFPAARQLAAVLEDGKLERFARLNGSFAFLHYDKGPRRLTVVRDPVGFLPLYCAQEGCRVGIASRIGLLKELGFDLGSPDINGLAELFTFQHALGQRTLFDRVSLLPQGWAITWAGQAREAVPYFHFPRPSYSVDNATHLERMRATLNRAVALRSYQPTGLWLSGGMDSRCLFSCLKANGTEFTAWTTGRPDALDCVLARRIAEAHGVPQTSLMVGEEFLDQFPTLASQVASIAAGEADVQRAHALLLYPILSAQVRTILAGICIGITRPIDEFRDLPADVDRKSFEARVLRFFSSRAAASPLFSRQAREEIGDWIDRSVAARLDELEPRGAAGNWESAFWLNEVYPRRWGAQVGILRRYLDVRYPYFDSDFLQAIFDAPPLRSFEDLIPPEYIIRANCPSLARWPTTRGGFPRRAGGTLGQMIKGSLLLNYNRACKVASSRFPRLSRWFWDRRTFAPYSHWFAGPLYPVLREILLDSRTTERGIFDPGGLEKALSAHSTLERDHTLGLAYCLTVELAYRALLD